MSNQDNRKKPFKWYTDGDKVIKVYEGDSIPVSFYPGKKKKDIKENIQETKISEQQLKSNINNQETDLSLFPELSSLSDSEKKLFLNIIKEYQSKGQSKTFNDLRYQDYEEIPVDIDTFLDDPNYLGTGTLSEGKSTIFPYWRKTLRDVFPDNITTKYRTLVLSGGIGLGKMNTLDTPVLTKDGFKPMGDIKPGEQVFGRDGKLHKVLKIFPHDEQDIYLVRFSDGTSNKCGLDHLWQVKDHHVVKKHKSYPPETKIIDTRYLLNHKLKEPGKNARFEIPMCEPIDFEYKELPLDPYVLGLLLGDGHLGNNQIDLTSADKEIGISFKNIIEKQSKGEYTVSENIKKTSKAVSYKIKKVNYNKQKNKYIQILEDLNLYNTDSYTKHIPKDYLYNSIENRISLLQGLLDTDGTANKALRRCDKKYSYNINYSTISPRLKDDIIWLIQSLGGTSTCIKHCSKYTTPEGELRQCKDHYRLSIRLPLNIQPFRLKRKKDLYNSCNHKPPVRYIVGVEKLDKQEKAQCIYIDGEEHLYIVNDFIVTHNTMMATVCILYQLYRMLCLKDPYTHYGLQPIDKITFSLMNITMDAAKGVAWDKLQQLLQSSPWFMSHGKVSGRENLEWQPPKGIELIYGSQPRHVIGRAVFSSFEDEISFQLNQDVDKQIIKAKQLISSIDARMQSRFMKGEKLPTLHILASSKRTDQSFLETYIENKRKNESKTTLIIDEPQWVIRTDKDSPNKFYIAVGNKFLNSEVLPLDISEADLDIYRNKGYTLLKVPMGYREQFIDDIDIALTDIAGISTSNTMHYISGPRLVNVKNYKLKNPFNKDIIEVGDGRDDKSQYWDFFDLNVIDPIMKAKPMFIHLDMSISGDKTGIAGVWIKGKKPPVESQPSSKELYYQLAFSVAIKAPKGYQISFEKNRQFIRWLKEQGFNIKGISSDTFQSAQIQQQLRQEGFNASIISVDRVDTESRICLPYQYLKSTIYDERIEMYDSKLLTDELIGLERNNNGKIDHSPAGINSKDTADALCGALYNASQNAEQFAYDFGEDMTTAVEVSSGNSQASVREQVSVELEDLMKSMFNPIKQQPTQQTTNQNNTQQIAAQTTKSKSPYLDFGMGPAQEYKPSYLSNGIIVW